MNWHDVTRRKKFISDIGNITEFTDEETQRTYVLPRYAVWIPDASGTKHMIADTGHNLLLLRKLHQISSTRVFHL